MIVGVFVYSTTAPTNITDNASPVNTYTLDASATGNTGDTNLRCYIYRADNITLPGAGSLAVSGGITTAGSIQAVAYTGASSGAPTATNQGLGNTAATGGNSGAAGNATSALHFACVDTNGGVANENIATTTPFTQQGAFQNGTVGLTGAFSDQINANVSRTCNWTWASSVTWTGVIAAYPVASAAVPPVNPTTRDRPMKRRRFR